MNLQDKEIKICIIGGGNVAIHLYNAWKDIITAKIVSSRDLEMLPTDFNIYLIAVSDKAIRDVAEEVVKKLGGGNYILAHTSGTTPMRILEMEQENIGVVYPMQTFSRNRELNYNEIPFFIEGNSSLVEKKLAKATRLISKNVKFADSMKREKIHLSSVFACNFVNRLWAISDEILQEEGLDMSILKPLLKETLEKIEYLSPRAAQTGPARRNDKNTINRHLKLLSSKDEISQIYQLLSKNIINEYNKDELNKL